jgi:hypothetical protein
VGVFELTRIDVLSSKREGPTNNQTPLALLASDRANIRYTHIKGTALATSLIQIQAKDSLLEHNRLA